jgi:hypothetical protein
MCFNNTDSRLACTPDAIGSVVLKGQQATTPGGRTLLQQIGALRGATSRSVREVVFGRYFVEANQCTPFGDFVVGRGRKRGVVLRAIVSTRAAGNDRNRLKLVCLPP